VVDVVVDEVKGGVSPRSRRHKHCRSSPAMCTGQFSAPFFVPSPLSALSLNTKLPQKEVPRKIDPASHRSICTLLCSVIKSVLQSGAAELLEAMFSPYQAIFSSHVFYMPPRTYLVKQPRRLSLSVRFLFTYNSILNLNLEHKLAVCGLLFEVMLQVKLAELWRL